jgi:outer membrane murein-binding lipoprotein Lpp
MMATRPDGAHSHQWDLSGPYASPEHDQLRAQIARLAAIVDRLENLEAEAEREDSADRDGPDR